MITDNIKAIADSVTERIRNPFSGTFIIIWVMYNWKLVYSIFNFDENSNLEYKLGYIEAYFQSVSSWQLFWNPIIYAFVATVTFLFFLNLSLLIYTFFSKWVKPAVFWIVDRNKIASSDDIKELREIASSSQRDYEETRNSLVKSQAENATLREKAIQWEAESKKSRQELDDLLATHYVYTDNFEVDNDRWSKNYWGKKDDTSVCTIENGKMTIKALPEDIPKENHETGAYIDIIGGVASGTNYLISVDVSSEEFTTMLFKLWVHDTVGGKSSQTQFQTPSPNSKTESLYFEANETNSIRVHLHCKAGKGKIFIHNLRIQMAK